MVTGSCVWWKRAVSAHLAHNSRAPWTWKMFGSSLTKTHKSEPHYTTSSRYRSVPGSEIWPNWWEFNMWINSFIEFYTTWSVGLFFFFFKHGALGSVGYWWYLWPAVPRCELVSCIKTRLPTSCPIWLVYNLRDIFGRWWREFLSSGMHNNLISSVL